MRAQDCRERSTTSRSHDVNWKGKGKMKGCAKVANNHTNTAGSHISSNHDRALACFELIQDPIAFVLLFIAVNS